MTIARHFTDWPRLRRPGPPYSSCSPNLTALSEACRSRFGTSSLGCYGVRPVRGGQTQSTHSFGAAIDISYATFIGRPEVDHLVGYLVGWSNEWHVSAIHDYLRQRIWRAGRTGDVTEACTKWWRVQRPDAQGMGQPWATWLHVECTMDGWHDDRPEAARGIL